jgi:hypothetical protein
MNVPDGPLMFGEVRAGGVVARLGTISPAVGRATTDRAMDGAVADGAQGGPLHADVGGVEPARSGGNNCTVRHRPRRQCGQHETSMPVVR